MISCFIVDDEPSAVSLLGAYIVRTPFLTLAGSSTNPVEALGLLQQQPVELLFMDIHMPHLSGLDLLRLLPAHTKVILTTASREFALEGFELAVLDYLLKPIAFERFLKATQKALPIGSSQAARAPSSPEGEDYLFVQTENKGKLIRVNLADIEYVEGLKNYVSIYTKDERIITLLSLKELQERLPMSHFLRVHKSYIIALPKIRAVEGNHILMKDRKASVPLGDTYRTAFFAALQTKVIGGKK
ncbi:LytTR family DNA-binding domain-containing protein [Hymenobacter sp. YC55]|uniref:LytR/AlgR family response regulator transcription factor n=1 Tax=Hymenobacter sp. YC55 TaxID=3034019 RepID=UPI0023F71C4D|nr:LytTR family DNA-binding domain-containing protein [Hymenobacter sp. YC55]MDF7815900.1 LytTR family DNA-binding domain-containing protein [Hymenobacter sp. YC55]